MANTSLPTGVNAGTTGHAGFHNTLHTEVNKLSRSTGKRNIESYLINGWAIDRSSISGSGIWIERVDDMVILTARGLDGSNATSSLMMATVSSDTGEGISRNFLTDSGTYKSGVHSNDERELWIFAYTTTNLYINNATPGTPGVTHFKKCGGYERQFIWHTTRNWPSFLPPAA